MNKAVMLSIQPKWCESIARGKKTIEVQKTRPKLEMPFKCYIYCTQGTFDIISCHDLNAESVKKVSEWRGKVIGEFVCDRIDEYESEFWNDDTVMQHIRFVERDEEDDDWVYYYTIYGNEYEAMGQYDICKQSCLTVQEIWKYVGVGLKTFYGWHIYDLKIYNTPKELREFTRACRREDGKCKKCRYWSYFLDFDDGYCNWQERDFDNPPQSWQYCEGI